MAPYIIPADFHAATLAEWCTGIPLETADISDANLTTLIARMSAKFDFYTQDSYSKTAGGVIRVDGSGSDTLYLPDRCTAVTTVETLNPDAITWTTQVSTVYEFVSSLDSTGAVRSQLCDIDHLTIHPPQMLVNVYASGSIWPQGKHNVRITGDFGWTTTPGDVKRAVALMCWEVVRPVGDYLRYAQSFTEDGGAVNVSADPTWISRIPEVQAIATDYGRLTPDVIGIG